MHERLTAERFGEIMDDFLKKNEINMLITLPEGTLEPRISDNTGMGPVVQFYILLAAIPTVFKAMFELMGLDENEKESLIDGMLELVKNEMVKPGSEMEKNLEGMEDERD